MLSEKIKLTLLRSYIEEMNDLSIKDKTIKVLKENVEMIENGLSKHCSKNTSHKVRLSDFAP